MCVQVTKKANRFEISSLLEKILLKKSQVVLNFCRTVYMEMSLGRAITYTNIS
jgi:hypothetical protein